MARIPGIRSLFRLPLSESRVAGDIDDEIAFHLEERMRDLTESGMDPERAREEALREFGDVREARSELEEIDRRRVRQSRRVGWWSELGQDVRFTGRALLRSPGFALVVILTLALGIGATTAIFSIVDAVLLRPFGVAEPDRLVTLREWRPGKDDPPRTGGTVAPANFFDWQEQARSFSSMSYFVDRPANLTGDGEPQEVQAQLVSANFFGTLGVQPILGRGFRPEEDDPEGDQPAGGDVVVLSHRLWKGRYGGDPGIVGRTIRVNDRPREVVGVLGPDFRLLDHKSDLWIPFAIPAGNRTTMGRFITAIGRLKPGVPLETAREEMNEIARRLEEAHPDFNTEARVWTMPLSEEVLGDVRPALLVLLGSVAMLLLIACTNVANLLLGRASARRQEIAVRLSLGATRGRLVRQLLTESVVLSLVGGVVGLAAAAVGTRALVRSLPATVQLPRLETASVDGRVLAFALAITVLTGIVFGLVPALSASRADLQGTLRDSGRGSTGGGSAMRLRNGLVVAEVGLALMLLVGAGLLLRSFQKLQAIDTGINAERVLALRVVLSSSAYLSDADLYRFVDRLRDGLEGLPGVQAVGTIQHLPLTDGHSSTASWRADAPKPGPEQAGSSHIRVVSGDYFRAQGVRVLRGRTFDERDEQQATRAYVVNEALARLHFPGEDPVGKQFVYSWDTDRVGEIIGVVEDVRQMGLTAEAPPAIYIPITQDPHPVLNVLVRTAGDPLAMAGAVRATVREIDPNLPIASMRSMESIVSEAAARSRLSSYLLGGFAAIALLLAAIGLYGIISYGVTQRRGEIGVRMALGASRGHILKLIVKQGMLLTAVGLAAGLLGAFALSRLLQSLLYEVAATDPLTYAAVPLLLLGVALLASYLPASRAARVDPVTALRAE